MNIYFHKNFEKNFKRLDKKIQKKFYIRLELFSKNPFSKILNNHALKGKYLDYRSINVTGDYRALYKQLDGDSVEFGVIHAHSNLYS